VRDALVRLQRVRVIGPSMVPTLYDGDLVLVLLRAKVRPGDVVLARFRTMPQRHVVKRAVRPDGGGWQLESDNVLVSGDSRSHGIADVCGRVIVRWTRFGGQLPRWWPRRVR
jgi:phage repressor protein C with HTH and peptisase S24 domain